MIILGTNSIKDTGFDVANSCRFNPGDSAYMHKTPDAGDRQKATFSCWIKRSLIASAQTVFWAGSDNSNYQAVVRFLSNDKIVVAEINSGSTTWEIFTDRVFRDTSAWYHIVVAMDTTQATAANRVKIYVNGVQETSLNTDGGYPAEDRNTLINTAVPHQIAHDYVGQYYGGYIAEACFLEGSQNAPTDFGEFDDSGIWKPIDVSGLTFGTNGFYLDFEDSAALGDDVSGNGNDFTVNNLTAIDQSTDTCTNNFATINSLDNYFYASTLSEGNLKQTCNSGNYSFNTSTFGLSQGKWYVEVKVSGSNMRNAIGIVDQVTLSATQEIGSTANGWGYQQGEVYNNNGVVANLGTFSSGNIVGIYLDLDNNKLYFAINGSIQNSGTGLSLTAPASTTNGNYFFAFGDNASSNSDVNEVNFGSPSFTISSGNTDANGYGNFEYNPSSGTFDGASKDFYALNTKNLAEYG